MPNSIACGRPFALQLCSLSISRILTAITCNAQKYLNLSPAELVLSGIF